jgi:hypothetical protein
MTIADTANDGGANDLMPGQSLLGLAALRRRFPK